MIRKAISVGPRLSAAHWQGWGRRNRWLGHQGAAAEGNEADCGCFKRANPVHQVKRTHGESRRRRVDLGRVGPSPAHPLYVDREQGSSKLVGQLAEVF